MQRLAAIAALLLAPVVFAADFPELKEKIDSVSRPLGTGTCATTRTGVWRVEGGVVVEITKPAGRCIFETMELVVGSERIRMTAADNVFYFGRRQGMSYATYEWYRGDNGKIFFATKSQIEADQIRGIMEIGCSNENCLYEASAR